MLSYKYPIEEAFDRPLVPAKVKAGKRSWLTTVVLLPVLVTIGIILLINSPFKMILLIVEKFSHQ